MAGIHPFDEAHRGTTEAALHQRLGIAEAMLRGRTQLFDVDRIRQEVVVDVAFEALAEA